MTTTNWHITGDPVTWTDGFGREYTRPSLAIMLDGGKQYAVVRNPLRPRETEALFLIIDCEAGREV